MTINIEWQTVDLDGFTAKQRFRMAAIFLIAMLSVLLGRLHIFKYSTTE